MRHQRLLQPLGVLGDDDDTEVLRIEVRSDRAVSVGQGSFASFFRMCSVNSPIPYLFVIQRSDRNRERLLLRERNREEITARLGRSAGARFPVRRRIMTVSDAQRLTGTSFAAANQLVARMTALGILREITGNARKGPFRYESYVRLFVDEPEEGV